MTRIVEMLPGEKVIFANSQWEVTNMHVQCPETDYFFPLNDVDGSGAKAGYGWPCHMAEKRWIDIDAFCEAWLVAIAHVGKKIPNAGVIIMRAKAKYLTLARLTALRQELFPLPEGEKFRVTTFDDKEEAQDNAVKAEYAQRYGEVASW